MNSVRWRGCLALLLLACSSKPPGDVSTVDIQAATSIATSDVKFIEILVHQLSDGALVYDSGILPSVDFQDTRQMLEVNVALAGGTDFVFDANAYDVNQAFLKAGNTVQEATQPAGHSTSILIVIDLNSGDTNPTGPADITAVTDNIPVLYPPTLTTSGSTYTLHYRATDADLDADGGPIDSQETLTYFSSILAGNVSGQTDLFTEAQDFTFTINDSQPVRILSAVVDRLNQLTYAITVIDPTSGSFQTVEYGEGYALFDDNTVIPSPRVAHHARQIGDPTGPHTGPIAVTVLKHQIPAQDGLPAGVAVEAISRSDDSLTVTPANVAYWDGGVIQSFNRYEEQPDANGNIIIDYKLRVQIAAPPDSKAPANGLIIDTVKFMPSAGSFVFAPDIQENSAFLPTPEIDSVTDENGSATFAPGDEVVVAGNDFMGAISMIIEIDDRQVYLQQSGQYSYPVKLSSADYETGLTFFLPDDIGSGSYDVVVCSYGRICTTAPGAISVAAGSSQYVELELPEPDSTGSSAVVEINQAGVMVGDWAGAGQVIHAAAWPGNSPLVLLAEPAGAVTSEAETINDANVVVGYYRLADSGNEPVDHAVIWNGLDASPMLLDEGGADYSDANGINSSNVIVGDVGAREGNSLDPAQPAVWLSPSAAPMVLAIPPGATGTQLIGINDSGMIIGNAELDGLPLGSRAALWTSVDAAPMLLDVPEDGDGSEVIQINPAGLIVGNVAAGGTNSAVVWDGTTLIVLPLPAEATGSQVSRAQGINSFGQITGFCLSSDGTALIPILWQPTGPDTWTPTLLPALGILEFPAGINDAGTIAGFHSTDGATFLAVTWTFVPGP